MPKSHNYPIMRQEGLLKTIRYVSILLGCYFAIIGFNFDRGGLNCAFAEPNIPIENMPSNTPPNVGRQILRLYASDPVERGRGAFELGKLGLEAISAQSFLVGMLDDYVILNQDAVPDFGRPVSIGELAAYALGAIKDARAVEPLIVALQDSRSKNVRWAAAFALGEIKDARAVEPLLHTLIGPGKDKSEIVRGNAAQALGKIKDTRAVEPLMNALVGVGKDNSGIVRLNVAIALGEIKDPRAVAALIIALKDVKSECVGNMAAYALGEIKDARAVEPLIAALKDDLASIRMWAAHSLGKIKDTRAVEPLIVALEDKDSNVGENAAHSLGEIKDARAVEPLIAALDNKHGYVGKYALEALNKITGQNITSDRVKWRQWWENNKTKSR
jgi:HEAT repeat protein